MPKVTLKFKTANLLWQFKQAIGAGEVDIDLKKCTLTCHCAAEEIKLAVEKFGAAVMEA